MRVIHWFRNDLRIGDNTALAAACRQARALVPVFILDDALLSLHREAHPRLRFLYACLGDLAATLETAGSRLIIMRGAPQRCLPALARACKASLVTWNRDYGPYAKHRDRAVRDALEHDGVEVRTYKDRVVFEGSELRTIQGKAYSVYTPYQRAWWRRYRVDPPGIAPAPELPICIVGVPADMPSMTLGRDAVSSSGLSAGNGGVPADAPWMPLGRDARMDTTVLPPGGSKPAHERLDAFLGNAAHRYHIDRNLPAVAGTSRLSPYLRFGAISIRECVCAGLALAAAEPEAERGAVAWLNELVWREFFFAVLDAHPRVLKGEFRKTYTTLEWDEDADRLQAWRAGMTGYPIVDAGMRELAATGWMHNRARMIVASFLTKDLHIDWRAGERWFMRRLIDGDSASNNGGWQWAASTGADAQAYMRIFNPSLQGERFDPGGEYVRCWIPELEGLRGKAVHRPWTAPLESRAYPTPIVDHGRERLIAIARYRAVHNGVRRSAG